MDEKREKYKEFLDIWSKYILYAEKTPPGVLLSEGLGSFTEFVDSERRFKEIRFQFLYISNWGKSKRKSASFNERYFKDWKLSS